MLVEAPEDIEKDMRKEDSEEKEKDDNNLGGEGEKSRKESQPLIVRDAIVEVIVKMFLDSFSLFPNRCKVRRSGRS